MKTGLKTPSPLGVVYRNAPSRPTMNVLLASVVEKSPLPFVVSW